MDRLELKQMLEREQVVVDRVNALFGKTTETVKAKAKPVKYEIEFADHCYIEITTYNIEDEPTLISTITDSKIMIGWDDIDSLIAALNEAKRVHELHYPSIGVHEQ